MPSPFPGMDPYIEARAIWPDMHLSLIPYIREALQPEIQPKYVARIGERVEIVSTGSSYVPDVMLVEPSGRLPSAQIEAGPLVVDEPKVVTYLDEERRIPFIEIIYRETGDVVTLIEVLSPGNKVGAEREKYIQKQADLMATHANLVEIDLLGYGRNTTLARDIPIDDPADWRYMICISRASQRNRLELYPIPLQNRLPRCRIPLRSADPDVVLDMPTIFTKCYDVGRYDLVIDYRKPPPVTLSDADKEWVAQRLQEAGLQEVDA